MYIQYNRYINIHRYDEIMIMIMIVIMTDEFLIKNKMTLIKCLLVIS